MNNDLTNELLKFDHGESLQITMDGILNRIVLKRIRNGKIVEMYIHCRELFYAKDDLVINETKMLGDLLGKSETQKKVDKILNLKIPDYFKNRE